MSIFGILNIGREGLLAHQRALNTTSNNIANVNTPNYTRQRTVFTPTRPALGAGGVEMGGGVTVEEIQRVADATLDAQLIREQQELSFSENRQAGLSRIEGIFEELGDTGISSSVREFFQSIQDLSATPNGTTHRQAVVEKALTLTEQIRGDDRRLDQLQGDANRTIDQMVNEINDISSQIAGLNDQIFTAEASGATASALRDTRDAALTELAEKIDFTYFERSDGQIAVFVAGGFLLVDAATAGQLEVRTRGSGPDPEFFDIYQNVSGGVSGPITSLITGGGIGGLLELRDTTVPNLRAQRDEFAYTLANEFNDRHDDGYGLSDNTQRDFFNPLAVVTGAASQIAVSTTIIGEPRHIAAAGAEDGVGNPGAPGDNVNALNMAAMETAALTFPVSGMVRTIGDFYDGIVGGLGSDSRSARQAAESQNLVVSELKGRRAAISGVSLDEEVTDLLRYERAYQASARVISTVDGLLEELMRI
jgi:flagellar hook-associated protein 1 FlgK